MKKELTLLIPATFTAGLICFWLVMKFGNCRDLGIGVAQCLAY